jgi:hypothetical protein
MVTTTTNAMSGQQESYSMSCSLDIHHSMAKMTKKYSWKSNMANYNLMVLIRYIISGDEWTSIHQIYKDFIAHMVAPPKIRWSPKELLQL